MRKSMIGRPRPVTATVTKPRWMQIPDPDVLAKIRRQSLGSNGSTESLTSVLDHDSYTSDMENDDNDIQGDGSKSKPDKNFQTVTSSTENLEGKESDLEPLDRYGKKYCISSGPKSSQNSLSAWEQWVIHKAKEERLKKQSVIAKKKQEKAEKEQKEKDIQKKTEIERQSWLEKKNMDHILAKKLEKMQIKKEKTEKEEVAQHIKLKSEEKFSLWIEKKKEEDRARRQKNKEERARIKEYKEKKKQMAEQNFELWLKQAQNRPKSAPNSFGYISGKMIGYHDRGATPQPSYYNPMPWQPVNVASSSTRTRTEKQSKNKTKARPYSLKSEKYY